MSQDYSCQLTDGSIKVNCLTLPYTEVVSDNVTWVDVIKNPESCEISSLLLTNTTKHYRNESSDCLVYTIINTTPKVTLHFVNRATLAISVEADGITCNISCNFNVWRHDNCSNYIILATQTHGRLPICNINHYTVSINISIVNGEIYLDDEPEIINQCRALGKSNSLYNHC